MSVTFGQSSIKTIKTHTVEFTVEIPYNPEALDSENHKLIIEEISKLTPAQFGITKKFDDMTLRDIGFWEIHDNKLFAKQEVTFTFIWNL